MQTILRAARRLHNKAMNAAHRGAFTKGHAALHIAYFGLVSLEAHGHYAWIAGALAVLSTIAAIGGEDA